MTDAELRAHKVEIQRRYMQRKKAKASAEELAVMRAKARGYSDAWRARDPEHAR